MHAPVEIDVLLMHIINIALLRPQGVEGLKGSENAIFPKPSETDTMLVGNQYLVQK